MSGRFAPCASGCDATLAANRGGAPVVICIALAVILVALIALEFGPLCSWFGPTLARRSSSGRVGQWESGLPGAWRLYRQFGSSEPHRH